MVKLLTFSINPLAAPLIYLRQPPETSGCLVLLRGLGVSVYFPGTELHILRWQRLVNSTGERRKKVGQPGAGYSEAATQAELHGPHKPVCVCARARVSVCERARVYVCVCGGREVGTDCNL